MNNIEDFVKEFQTKKDSNKTISLYDAIKKYCPETIKTLNYKIYGKKFTFKKFYENKWYTSIVNYLLKMNVFETDKKEEGTYHLVTEDYTNFFLNPVSTVFNPSNHKKHLILYKESIKEFLIAVKIIDKNEKELLKKEEKKEKLKLDKKKQKIVNSIGLIFLIYSIIQFFTFTAKFDLHNLIILVSNSLLFTIACLLLVKEN